MLASLPLHVLFFFFSSRRRHTRFDCDWSSDVCSSDLRALGVEADDRLVDDQNAGSVEEGGNDRELLAASARVVLDVAVEDGADLEERRELVDLGGAGGPGNPPPLTDQGEEFPAPPALVHKRLRGGGD